MLFDIQLDKSVIKKYLAIVTGPSEIFADYKGVEVNVLHRNMDCMERR